MSGAPTIEISLPDKKIQSLGRYKPKGLVVMSSGLREDSFRVPVAVARHLLKLQGEDELEVSTFAELRSLISTVSADCAFKRLLSLIDKRDYSSLEADEKLRLDGYPEDIRVDAVGRAKEYGLINDVRYGEFYVRGKVSAGWGMQRIQRELERKGIDIETVPGWPDEYFSDEQDFERALAIASRKHLTGKNDFQKIMRLLASKGYSSSISYRVAQKILDDE